MPEGKVFGFFSAPGGVGKTTIALLLGWLLRELGKKVLLIDMDPSIALSLMLVKERINLILCEKRGLTLTNLFRRMTAGENVSLEEYVISRSYPSDEDLRIDMITSDLGLPEVIDALWYSQEEGRELVLRKLLESLEVRRSYDCTIIDTIPFYDRKYAIMVLHGADRCLIPLRPSLIDVYRTEMMLNQLPRVAKVGKEDLLSKIGLVFNMVRRGSRGERYILTYREFFRNRVSPNLKVFRSVIPLKSSFQRIGSEDELPTDREEVKRELSGF
ncbi:MAG: hypothetical protein DRO05_05690, partial [Thermoproteota archaeon]